MAAPIHDDWEPFPSYADLADGIQDFVVKTYKETFVEEREPLPIESTWTYYNITVKDITLVVFLSLIWTVLRYVLSEGFFKPLARRYGLTPTNVRKMPESGWKFLCYLSAFSYTCYVVLFSGEARFFHRPSTVWQGWNLADNPTPKIYAMYMAQCSFYLHSLYATVFLDTWRKDSLVMMIHHVLTLALISISYSLRYHNIGSLVLFTHDLCDILLEFTKLNVYFKIQNNRLVKTHEWFANVAFVLFTVTWYVSRLYWYPLRVLHTATTVVQNQNLVLPCAVLMNSLLWILQLLNIYWFMFIVQFLYRVATGQVKEVDDTREYDVEEKFRQLSVSKSSDNIVQNGTVKFVDDRGDGAAVNGSLPSIARNRSKKES